MTTVLVSDYNSYIIATVDLDKMNGVNNLITLYKQVSD